MGAGTNLASYVARFKWNDLPHPLRAKLLDHVVDTIGVMFAGINVDVCVGARRAAQAWGRGEEATVAGLEARYPTPTAAFLNALHGRIQNYDDTYEPGTVHPGSPVVSAALSLSECRGVDGSAFLSAVFAGYEVATRVAAAVSPSHYAAGFHNTGTCTVFGAAAAGARFWGSMARQQPRPSAWQGLLQRVCGSIRSTGACSTRRFTAHGQHSPA